MKFIFVEIATLTPRGNLFAADAFLCGDPPPVSDESLKGELSGQANFLSRFIGDADRYAIINL